MQHDATDPYPQPGDVIARRFRVDRLIATGAAGAVFQGHHLELGQKISLKMLLPELRNHPDLAERFVREARVAVRIKNPHVCRVLDVGKLATGIPWMALEFLEGRDLEATLEQQGALDPVRAVGYVLQACEAIAEAHALGIVHRDLKPGNLFVSVDATGRDVVKVLDFGISKAVIPADLKGEKERSLTGTSMVGSPDYMSPEQIVSSRSVDLRADVWSLGVTLYQLISGELPFDAEDVADLFSAIVHDDPVPLRARVPAAPEGLEAALARCFEKQPERRWSSVAELAAAIAEFGPEETRSSAEIAAGYMQRADARLSGDFGVRAGRESLPAIEGATNAPPATSAELAQQRQSDQSPVVEVATLPAVAPPISTSRLPAAVATPSSRRPMLSIVIVATVAIIALAIVLFLTLKP
jgi:serine/threonine protein kinase